MQDKREKLKRLLVDLELPVLKGEMDKRIEALSEEELDLLINKAQVIKDYQEESDKLLSEKDPEKYKKIKLEYLEKVHKLEQSRLNDMEKVQEKVDSQLSEVETQTKKEIDDAFKKENSDLEDINKSYQKFYADVKKALQNPS
jgi:hypothetical protein